MRWAASPILHLPRANSESRRGKCREINFISYMMFIWWRERNTQRDSLKQQQASAQTHMKTMNLTFRKFQEKNWRVILNHWTFAYLTGQSLIHSVFLALESLISIQQFSMAQSVAICTHCSYMSGSLSCAANLSENSINPKEQGYYCSYNLKNTQMQRTETLKSVTLCIRI